MARKRLTAGFVESVKPRTDRNQEDFYDELVTGFYLRVFRTGRKSWMLYYRTPDRKQRRMELGRYPVLGLTDAREKAKGALQDITAGIDPLAVRAEVEEYGGQLRHTLAGAANEFIERHCKINNKRWEERERIFRVYVIPYLGHRGIEEIKQADILDLVLKIERRRVKLADGRKGGGHVMANRVSQAIRALYNWLIKQGRCQVNPARFVAADKAEKSGNRFLSETELRVMWQASDDIHTVYAPILKLLALTGQRLGEVCSMRWRDIDMERKVWTIPDTKNTQPHEVPLSQMALEALNAVPVMADGDADWVFPAKRGAEHVGTSTTNSKKKLDRQMAKIMDVPLEPWVIHDLRRTVRTGLARLKVHEHVGELILNHQPKKVRGVERIYNQYGYLEEKADALERWGEHARSVLAEVLHGQR